MERNHFRGSRMEIVHNAGPALGFALEMVPFGNSPRFFQQSCLAGFHGRR
jgi:hypothetical protein